MAPDITISLFAQAPGIVGIIIIVGYFLKAIEKRDAMFTESIGKFTDRLKSLEELLIEHDTIVRNEISKSRKPRKKK